MNMLKVFIIGLAVVLAGGSAQGYEVVTDPTQIVDTSYSRYIMMDYGDNLMERIGGVDFIVDKGAGEYYIFFGKNVSGGVALGGYVYTDNFYNNTYSGYEGWCDGNIDRNTFLEGSSPDYVLAIYDPDGGEFAQLYLNGDVTFDDANLVFWESGAKQFIGSGDIEYDGVIGGLSSNLVFEGTGTYILEHIVLVPEPASMTLLAVGSIFFLRRRRRK